MKNGRVTVQLEERQKPERGQGDPQLRNLDHAWASTVFTFQGRTVDNVIAVMQARYPRLTIRKSFYVEISQASDRSELVTDAAPRAQRPVPGPHRRAHCHARGGRRDAVRSAGDCICRLGEEARRRVIGCKEPRHACPGERARCRREPLTLMERRRHPTGVGLQGAWCPTIATDAVQP